MPTPARGANRPPGAPAEGSDGARHLIDRAFAALKPEGRLLLSDYFPDNTRTFNPFGVLMGVTMMAATARGLTFTHEQIVAWLGEAEFEAIRLVEPIGFQQVFVASKPRRSSGCRPELSECAECQHAPELARTPPAPPGR